MSQPSETLSISKSVEKLKSIKYFLPARTIEEANSLLPKINELIENYIKSLGNWKKENETSVRNIA